MKQPIKWRDVILNQALAFGLSKSENNEQIENVTMSQMSQM
jgi:hypothetical protein